MHDGRLKRGAALAALLAMAWSAPPPAAAQDGLVACPPGCDPKVCEDMKKTVTDTLQREQTRIEAWTEPRELNAKSCVEDLFKAAGEQSESLGFPSLSSLIEGFKKQATSAACQAASDIWCNARDATAITNVGLPGQSGSLSANLPQIGCRQKVTSNDVRGGTTTTRSSAADTRQPAPAAIPAARPAAPKTAEPANPPRRGFTDWIFGNGGKQP